MRGVLISAGKILAFLGMWVALTSVVVLSAVVFGGEGFYGIRHVRVTVEIALLLAVIIPVIVMVRFVDKRPLSTAGFAPAGLYDLVLGALIGGAVLLTPLAALLAIGAAQYAPDLSSFDATALGLGVVVCFFNVVAQQALVRSYIFQELWAKYGAWVATLVTTALFVALHAGPISHGTQGLIAAANILLASLMMSLAYVRTGQLWLATGIHLGWNGLQGPVLNINVTGNELSFGHWQVFAFPGDPLLTGGAMGIEGGLIGLIGPALGLAIVAFAFKQQAQPSLVVNAQ